ncbi:MAG: PHP domain-containing protein [Crenarchaeota archaeon]|nr:PHP domain-containing protein [Thermoproteota archaeon]MDA1124157.1 PHP domain-containing protein [Thermoproteota archaeon]
MLEMLRAELHCHNVYSNGHVGNLEPPFDSNVTINEQLEKSLKSKLDILFVTNHNTLDGFKQITDYKNNHEKFSNLNVYPAVEVTTDKEAHVLVYGLQEEIKSFQSIDEIIDAAKSQDAVTIAPHPFSLVDALRNDSSKCDLFEVFNSSNVDIYSNKKAEIFAKENNLLTTAGSDSHIASTIGRCTNLINSENNLDDILYAMKKGKISIEKMEYVTPSEVLEHIQYKIENSKEYIDYYVKEFYPKYFSLFNSMYKFYMFTKKSLIWNITFKLALFGLKRISYKINFEGYDPYAFRTRDIPAITKMIF